MGNLWEERNLVLPLSLAGNDTANYLPFLKRSLGDMDETVFICRIAKMWVENGGRPFFYFNKPSENSSYRSGFSWYEQLGLEPKEIKRILQGIGSRIGVNGFKKEEFLSNENLEMDSEGKLINKSFLVGWSTDSKGRIWYLLNECLFEKLLSFLSQKEECPGNNLMEKSAWAVEQLAYYQGSLQREISWCQSELRSMVGTSRSGYVFFLSNGKGLFKFHASRELNADIGADVAKIGVIATDNTFRLEQCIHYTFKDCRHEGDWFSVDLNDSRLLAWMSLENGEFFFSSEVQKTALGIKVEVLEKELEVVNRMLWKPNMVLPRVEEGLVKNKPLIQPKSRAEVLEMLGPALDGKSEEERKRVSETAIANFEKIQSQSNSVRSGSGLTAIGGSIGNVLPKKR